MEMNRRQFLKLSSILPLLVHPLKNILVNASGQSQSEMLPNIVILVFDALSAENMSLYGYNRETTPNMAKFAEQATVFHSHYAGGSFTSSGTASLLTGTYPWTHRAIHLYGTVDEKRVKRNVFELFRLNGYYTIGYSHNFLVTLLLHQFRDSLSSLIKTRELCLLNDLIADRIFPNDFNVASWSEWIIMRDDPNPRVRSNLNPSSLFASLVQSFFRSLRTRGLARDYGELFPRGIPSHQNLLYILEDAIDWIMDQLIFLPNPYLCYFHVLPPHDPYTTRVDFIDKFNDGWLPQEKQESQFSEGHSGDSLNAERRLYDEYLAYADSEFGRLYDFMLQEGLLDNTYLIVTSDHGEMFERGILGHLTPTLYQPISRIPLLISRPFQTEREDVYSPTSCVDLLPTLLSETQQAIPSWCEGNILPTFRMSDELNECNIYTVDAKNNPKNAALHNATISLVRGNYKLISYLGYENDSTVNELFDLEHDPEERQDLVVSHQSILKDLWKIMEVHLKSVNEPYKTL